MLLHSVDPSIDRWWLKGWPNIVGDRTDIGRFRCPVSMILLGAVHEIVVADEIEGRTRHNFRGIDHSLVRGRHFALGGDLPGMSRCAYGMGGDARH